MTVNEGIFRDVLRLFIWFPFRWIVNILSVNAAFLLFKLMGDLHFYAAGGIKKENVSARIKNLMGPKDGLAGQTVRKYYENHYLDRMHIFLYPRLNSIEKIQKYVRIQNPEILEKELLSGKGALIVQPHFGPVQITLLTLALLGHKPLQIGYPSDLGLSRVGRSVAFRYRLKYEGMLPAPILPADEYMGKAYKHLIRGGVVLTTGDGAGKGVFLGEHKAFKFLGTERMLPLGPAAWAIKTGAAFIPTFIVVEGYNKFRIVFEDPIKGIYGDAEKDRLYITERFLSVAEEYIRKYPYCWHFWDEIQDN